MLRSLLASVLVLPLLVSACGGGNAPPTPAGQAEGKPTLLTLWTFP